MKSFKCEQCNKDCWSIKSTLCRVCIITNSKNARNKYNYRRQWSLLKKYDIDSNGFEVLWEAFRGKCGICNIELKRPIPARGQPLNVVVIDHNHITGNLRGLLCNGCNKGLGLFKDNIESLHNAIKWLEYSKK